MPVAWPLASRNNIVRNRHPGSVNSFGKANMSHAMERCKDEGLIRDHMRDSELEVIVLVEGFDPMTSQAVQALAERMERVEATAGAGATKERKAGDASRVSTKLALLIGRCAYPQKSLRLDA